MAARLRFHPDDDASLSAAGRPSIAIPSHGQGSANVHAGRREYTAGAGASHGETGASEPSKVPPAHPQVQTDAHDPIAPPRYGLRALLLSVTAISVLFALLRTIDAGLSAAIILLLVMIAAHVAATALGTKSRDRSQRTLPATRPLARQGSSSMLPTTAADVAAAAAPGTRLGHHAALGWMMIVVSALGGVAGALAGGWMLASHYSGRLAPLALGFGTLSSGVLGGFVGFFVCSCLGVFLRALGEAATPATRGRD